MEPAGGGQGDDYFAMELLKNPYGEGWGIAVISDEGLLGYEPIMDWGTIFTDETFGMRIEVTSTYVGAYYDFSTGDIGGAYSPAWDPITTSTVFEYEGETYYAKYLTYFAPAGGGGGVPEPSTIILILLGLSGIALKMRRRK